MPEIADRLNTLRQALAEAARLAGRAPESVHLVAVSKTAPVTSIREAYDAGQRVFGENRAQELLSKVGELPPDCRWHLIGHLQGNKAKVAVEHAALVHSVDSLALLQRLDRLAGEAGRRLPILLQVNLAGEASKSGCTPAELDALSEAATAAPHLDWQGLMTIGPLVATEPELHRLFAGLREHRDRLASSLGRPLPELSMGMSGDYRIAIAEGATLVRIGSAIFGGR